MLFLSNISTIQIVASYTVGRLAVYDQLKIRLVKSTRWANFCICISSLYGTH